MVPRIVAPPLLSLYLWGMIPFVFGFNWEQYPIFGGHDTLLFYGSDTQA